MTRWSIDKELVVPPEFIKHTGDLLKTVMEIQSYKKVNSARLHPLLCATTSAQEVKYSEQREMGSDASSGKFNSMLIDIFGKNYSEDKYFTVNRKCVFEYKKFAVYNTEKMKEIIWRICKYS